MLQTPTQTGLPVQGADSTRFLKAWRTTTPDRGAAQGLVGRLIRGKAPADFEKLSDDPSRKIVMLLDSCGLEELLGKTGYEQLITIGYTLDHIRRKVVDERNRFKLAVWPAGGPAVPATWDHVVDTVVSVYPAVAALVEAQRAALKRTSWEQIEALAGYTFKDVDRLGLEDVRFMTYERLQQSRGTLVEVRAFLYHSVHLRELYHGDGYTYDAAGVRGVAEYLVPNMRLDDLQGLTLLDIEVSIPNSAAAKAAAGKGLTMNRKLEMYELPSPALFDPNKTGELWRVDYNSTATAAADFVRAHGVKAAAHDRLRVALMPIDCQIGFAIPGSPLFVGGRSGNGAVDDSRRLCEFIYRNLQVITHIYPTFDTHTAYQIFHPVFWVDERGNHPAPFSQISLEDIERGVWRVNPSVAGAALGDPNKAMALQHHALHYARELARRGKYSLTIWPYHVLLGSIEHALVPSIDQAIFFHTIARCSQSNPEIKGGNPLTENYSVLSPEVTDTLGGRPIAQRNTAFIEALLNHDIVAITGQAKSHCVAWSIADLLDDINKKDPALAKKVYLIEDCTSSVVVPGVIDYTDEADAAFDRFRQAGMHVVRSTDPMHTWPGINPALLGL